ncbi:MAG: prepilin-type N-terminal cleavage/methylation domain-containing protein, partial [Deltaproteobacteria bacterium]|nr:prepilin-type N-terminal cleavage/methylation domain-containing protein [Deltaproteobacteria bacterium]
MSGLTLLELLLVLAVVGLVGLALLPGATSGRAPALDAAG